MARSRIFDETTLTRSRGVAADELRRHNLEIVVDRLHLLGPLTRSELAERTGLNRSTIGALLAELIDLGLVEEGPAPATAGPGRPSPVARPRPQGAVALAIELSVDSVAVATVGIGGRVFNEVRVATPRGRFTPKETVDDVTRLAAPLIAALPKDHNFAGVGVAVAGLVRRSDGFVHLAPNLGWRDLPLGDWIAEELGLPNVMLANEADLGALAEYRRGAGTGARHMIYVAGEAGIGIGIVQDGKPMLGAAGYAGEAGHVLMNPNGRRCRCGATGCWETEAGEEALAMRAGIPDNIVGQALLETIIREAETGNRRILNALDDVGRWLGLGIGNLINIFNPELVVVGGFYHELYHYLEGALHDGVADSALDAPRQGVTIHRSLLGVDAPLLGASELILSEVISNPASFSGVQVGVR